MRIGVQEKSPEDANPRGSNLKSEISPAGGHVGPALRAARFARRRGLPDDVLGGLRRLVRVLLDAFLSAHAIGSSAQPLAHPLALRLLALGLGFALGLSTRVEFAADELHLRNLGAVA